jgi:hypothetical protein
VIREAHVQHLIARAQFHLARNGVIPLYLTAALLAEGVDPSSLE